MTYEDKKLAKDLAVSYEAFWRALDVPDRERNRSTWNSVLAWATMLSLAQNAAGIELMTEATLDSHKANAKAKMERIDSIMNGSIHEDGISPV